MTAQIKAKHKTMKQLSKDFDQSANRQLGFTLIEVIVAASILAVGLLSIVQVFPYGIRTSQRAEDVTQASLLAQTMFEGLKTDPINYPIIPNLPDVLIPIPGNGYDDDTNNNMFQTRGRGFIQEDLNRNGKPDVDFDGMPEVDGVRASNIRPNGLDDDGDGVIDDDGDSGSKNIRSVPRGFSIMASDGDYYYDPEPNIDEEYADGIDNDGDGLVDEDTRLASVRVLGGQVMLPLLAGDGFDNDGDGEDDDGDPRTPAKADGLDNDGDGQIDEGIDEEIWDGEDNDGDGRVDEDCKLAAFPYVPAKFPKPYDRYGWQIRVGRVPDNGTFGLTDQNGDGIPELGDGIDNDGDGLIDEELPDGIDNDYPVRPARGISWLSGYTRQPSKDGLVDEDTIAAPLPNWRRIEIVITWGGNNENDDDGTVEGIPEQRRRATRVDPSSTGELGEPGLRGSRQSELITYNRVDWSVDEEKFDGLDDDYDGQIDEDTYNEEFVLVGFINLSDPSQSFTMRGGQPRGLVPSSLVNQ